MSEIPPKNPDQGAVQEALVDAWLEEKFDQVEKMAEAEGLRPAVKMALATFLEDLFSTAERATDEL